ncbi:hypothetical protein [Hymenobacter sp. YC55]|uniref:hypothetical protein n=1 Tax=Hymenobacter sp. YC55 TaxID=3034019 RepID=UPI0023F78A74|nr:hypothetical protein [Hymenobacter sp. YC55]MDF7811957.1 hypothetical protein [Hymenobacter sp. YC55]
MNNICANSLLLFLIGVLSSCEGHRVQYGIVKDKQSRMPLNHVLVEVNNYHENEEIYTDSKGRFIVDGAFGGCMPDCPDIVIKFSKKGYQSIEMRNPTGTVFYLASQMK